MINGRIRKLVYEYGEYIIEEAPWGDQWDAGDPVPDNKETLVVFLDRRSNKEYGVE